MSRRHRAGSKLGVAFQSGAVLLGLSACGAGDDANAGQSATCVAGQLTGCTCADGQPPSISGCAAAAAGPVAAGAAAPAAGRAGSSGAGAVTATQAQQVAAGRGGSPASNTAPAAGGSAGNAASTGNSGAPAAAGTSGAAATAGSGGSAPTAAGSGAAGSAGSSAASGGRASIRDCGDGAMMGKDRKAATKMAGGGRHTTGSVDFKVKAGNRYTRLQTTLEVPPKPNGNSTLFMWPGLEPLEGVSMNFNPIGRGVLQPVLTWGTSCAPGGRTGANNWWISGMYVNISAEDRMYRGCFGGKVMDVKFGDKLYMDMFLKEDGTTWSQVVTNLSNNQTVAYDIDLKNQDQNWALFEIETASSTLPSSDVIFTDTVLTLANPEPESCEPDAFGPMDYYTAPLTSADGTKCCLERIVLREMGVAATTMDP
ncbi:MAG TPA: hypothetical protein VFN67_32870 [Polyangiales bacterium]|nr:hypothetical protein [Polyangiales bacterium]